MLTFKKKNTPLRASWYNSDRSVSPQTLSGPNLNAEVHLMFEGWLGVHYNARRPELVWTISYVILHTLLYEIKSKYQSAESTSGLGLHIGGSRKLSSLSKHEVFEQLLQTWMVSECKITRRCEGELINNDDHHTAVHC